MDRREFMATAIGAAVVGIPSLGSAATKRQLRQLTLVDQLESTRPMFELVSEWFNEDHEGRQVARVVFDSPDGQRFAFMLIRGDAHRDRIVADVYAGSYSAELADVPVRIASLDYAALGAKDLYRPDPTLLVLGGLNVPRWIDDDQLALLWEDANGIRQIFKLDVTSRRTYQVTNHPTDVAVFGLSKTGQVLYAAPDIRTPSRSTQLLEEGFAVRNKDAWSFLSGDVDGVEPEDLPYSRYLLDLRDLSVRRISEPFPNRVPRTYFNFPFSPDGRLAIVDQALWTLPKNWQRYDDPVLKDAFEALRTGKDYPTRLISQLHVVDVVGAKSRALIDAPLTSGRNLLVSWSPNSDEILLGPIHLPLQASSPNGLKGESFAVVSTRNGVVAPLELPDDAQSTVEALRWISHDELAVDGADGKSIEFARNGPGWSSRDGSRSRSTQQRSVEIELAQGLNEPPTLVAYNRRTGRKRLLKDLNPQLRDEFQLGHVEQVRWVDSLGQAWTGMLYYPPEYVAERAYPAVIQSRGALPINEFSLSGQGGYSPGLGPGNIGFIAQPLAARGFVVLQIADKYNPEWWGTPEEPEVYMRGYVSAAEFLCGRGMAIHDKIGLLGFSRGGWRIQHTLINSEFPFGAAVSADNWDAGYFQFTLAGSSEMSYVRANGGEAFGPTLGNWITHGTTFNADKINAPLQLISASTPGLPLAIGQGWEMFTRLRALRKPTELYVIPNVCRGSHFLQNPRQWLATQQRIMDWWDFWLRDVERSTPTDPDQYPSWQRMRSMRLITSGTS
jgi:hypothetical protein